jgi:hypothetical protein
VMAVEKRRSNGWQAFGSYTFSRVSGLQVSGGAKAEDPQVSTIAGNPYLVFGEDPNSLTNARGRLPNDRPHMLRVMGSVDVPWIGLVIAGNAQYFTGKPWAATALISPLPQGNQRVLIEPRGSRRLSSQTLVDLRVSKSFSIRTTRIELLADLLNAFNDTAEERLASDNIAASNFGQPTAFVDPRRAMLGVRIDLGR